jgi:hypothetical protein
LPAYLPRLAAIPTRGIRLRGSGVHDGDHGAIGFRDDPRYFLRWQGCREGFLGMDVARMRFGKAAYGTDRDLNPIVLLEFGGDLPKRHIGPEIRHPPL